MFDDGADDDPQLVIWCRYGLFLGILLHCLAIGLYLWGHVSSAVQHVSNLA